MPASAYDIGQGYEVIVLYADERRVALRYVREDSAGAQGYTVHLDGLCTDPNLLALYTGLDARGRPSLRVPTAEPTALQPTPCPCCRPASRLASRRGLGSGRCHRRYRQLHGPALVQRVVADSGPAMTGACPPHELTAAPNP